MSEYKTPPEKMGLIHRNTLSLQLIPRLSMTGLYQTFPIYELLRIDPDRAAIISQISRVKFKLLLYHLKI